MNTSIDTLLQQAGINFEPKQTYIKAIFEYANDIDYTESNINSETIANFKTSLQGIVKLMKYKKFEEEFKKNPSRALNMQDYEWDKQLWEAELLRINAEITTICTPNCDVICPNCKKQMVHSRSEQKRSSDEGLTFIYDCCNCGNHWEVNS